MKGSSQFYAANKMLTIFANDKAKADACTHFLDRYLKYQLLNQRDLLPKTWEYIKANMKEEKAKQGEPQDKKPAAGEAPAGGGTKGTK